MTLGLEFFKDRHLGERCFIICNGPSLNRMDLSLLKNEVTIGLNKIFLGVAKFGFYPKYLMSVNEKVIAQSIVEFQKMSCVKFIGDRYKPDVRSGALLWRVRTQDYGEDFSYNLDEGIQEGNTVTYAALQLAFFMGFKQVFIVGMDHKFHYSGLSNESQFLEGSDSNHFSPDYFSNQNWDTPDLERSEKFYRVAKDIFEGSGRNIYDATVDGHCDIFEKISYEGIFG